MVEVAGRDRTRSKLGLSIDICIKVGWLMFSVYFFLVRGSEGQSVSDGSSLYP